MNYNLGEYLYLILSLIIPILGGLGFRYLRWRKRKQELFVSSRFRKNILGEERWGNTYLWFFPLFFIGLLSLIIAIVDIVGGTQKIDTQQKTGNILFAIDVSNSMNAEDVAPNRLVNAKNIIVNSLPNFGTDRVGLIAFAGKAKSIMPLTTDYSSAESYIGAIETSIIKVQGTDFLQAVQAAVEKFKPIDKNARHLILLSDGEDNEGNVEAAIKLAKKEHIRITTLGVGTEEGAPVPDYLYGQLMGYKTDLYGETVLSKRQTQALEKIAQETGGIYIDANSMENAINQLVNHVRGVRKDGVFIKIQSEILEHYYQYPLGIAVFIFFILFILNPKRNFNL